ncbi:hypothetical protein [Oscillatoria acuminata]|uniref:Uncharacterized protein n=1 Tax=Oscillatoria acuminata PCC 6304 TaxID=56110 RepID=K9TDS7_9CYAN|nr:hypothetical protein [Oscillatoria acuminata]AFY80169.1 hypothetical protein Oscil6304_0420 [Oscillatoria acuminata PCC 6304]
MFFNLLTQTPTPEQYETETPVIVAATTTAANLIPANPNRVGLGLINQTDEFIYLNTGEMGTSPASASAKIFVIPAQSYVSFEGKIETPTEALNVVWAAAAAGNLTAIERVVVG